MGLVTVYGFKCRHPRCKYAFVAGSMDGYLSCCGAPPVWVLTKEVDIDNFDVRAFEDEVRAAYAAMQTASATPPPEIKASVPIADDHASIAKRMRELAAARRTW